MELRGPKMNIPIQTLRREGNKFGQNIDIAMDKTK